MKIYVGREGEGNKGLYLLARKPFQEVISGVDAHVIGIGSLDKDGEMAVCPTVWHRLGGTRLKPLESRCIDLTLTIKPIKKGT